MRSINFTKMAASGNDFVIVRGQGIGFRVQKLANLAKKMCDRKYGIGADGLLVLEKSKRADIKMRIFNADGSEAEMCGNGARCAALYSVSVRGESKEDRVQGKISIETKAGLIDSEINGNSVKIKLTDPKGIKLDIPVKINNRIMKVNFIDTGVPHTVIFVEGLDRIDAVNLGRSIRFAETFMPRGTNVDFVEVLDKDSIKVRTYERGVEDETLACGTGSVASVLLYALRSRLYADKINVHTQSGEILRVYFDKINNHFDNVWLEGKAKKVYEGVYYV